ncbi:MAG: M28 family peptidase [Planctomycetes bacterium]|nr:M28 family peptidase [Planctomycetota bacterium]
MLLPLLAGLTLLLPQDSPGAPPSRELLRGLTARTRLAGTSGSWWGARYVQGVLEEAGWTVELDPREVLLSLPRALELQAFEDDQADAPFLATRHTWDPNAAPPRDLPPFNAWSASGTADAPLVDVGRGLRRDFERLRELGVDVRGCVAIARYGGSYRGVKARLAQEYGCAGLLLFSDPADDGAAKGAVWPDGPWKPDWAAQRGSISPLAKAPGDPSTPGWPSPAPGVAAPRLAQAELDAALPRLPCMPVPARDALALLARLDEVTVVGDDGTTHPERLGPGPVHVRLTVDAPRELRTIVNVHARLAGAGDLVVVAGNHRDAWVRGAHDAGGGTVALLRAAQRLGERAATGWRPAQTLQLSFWDAEESGLVGSTEWAEGEAQALQERCIAYVNADTAVSGAQFRGASGTPGLLATLEAALAATPVLGARADGAPANLLDDWRAALGDARPALGLPGSGSDYTVFLHHLGVPVLDVGFTGSGGGQYHTAFDDFAVVDRFLDPQWLGHETAGLFVANLLVELAERGFASFDEAQAARRLAEVARGEAAWLGEAESARLAQAFEAVAAAPRVRAGSARFYQRLAARDGLEGRRWFKNRLWAPGLDTGYASETFPSLRRALEEGPAALAAELDSLVAALDALAAGD